ncbi:uncharacterized protein CTRU02_215825 [Colletotrichum truncatum]|uniref:Uncharacterized protein n=1 Tax=Colletotrichum truncatum TaxID=5467 RepID=A0ACC3YAW8_COLTU
MSANNNNNIINNQQQQQQQQQHNLRPRPPVPADPDFVQTFPYTSAPTTESVRRYVDQTILPAAAASPASASRASAILLTNLEGEARLLDVELRAAAVTRPGDVRAAAALRDLNDLWPHGQWCPPAFRPPGDLPASLLTEMLAFSRLVSGRMGRDWLPRLWMGPPAIHPAGVLHLAMQGNVYLTRHVIRAARFDFIQPALAPVLAPALAPVPPAPPPPPPPAPAPIPVSFHTELETRLRQVRVALEQQESSRQVEQEHQDDDSLFGARVGSVRAASARDSQGPPPLLGLDLDVDLELDLGLDLDINPGIDNSEAFLTPQDLATHDGEPVVSPPDQQPVSLVPGEDILRHASDLLRSIDDDIRKMGRPIEHYFGIGPDEDDDNDDNNNVDEVGWLGAPLNDDFNIGPGDHDDGDDDNEMPSRSDRSSEQADLLPPFVLPPGAEEPDELGLQGAALEAVFVPLPRRRHPPQPYQSVEATISAVSRGIETSTATRLQRGEAFFTLAQRNAIAPVVAVAIVATPALMEKIEKHMLMLFFED